MIFHEQHASRGNILTSIFWKTLKKFEIYLLNIDKEHIKMHEFKYNIWRKIRLHHIKMGGNWIPPNNRWIHFSLSLNYPHQCQWSPKKLWCEKYSIYPPIPTTCSLFSLFSSLIHLSCLPFIGLIFEHHIFDNECGI